MSKERGKDWVNFDKVFKKINDMVLRHHRTKKHLEPDYATTFRTMAKNILINSYLVQL